MRILHTSDWHVGKRLGRYDRSQEHRDVIAEVATIAEREEVDLVVHSGDLFDRPLPPVDALEIALSGLVALTRGGECPVVVIAGNHDSPAMFEALAPFLAGNHIYLVGDIKPPTEGGVLELDTGAGRAVVSCFPFLREGRAFNVWEPPETHYQAYADRLRRISWAYAEHAASLAGTDGVSLLVAHFLVGGSKVHGHGAPRGERELHMGEAYSATPDAIPPAPQYVALGHIHAPQPVPGAQVPAEYAGSLLELDFGEAGEQKRVVLVEVEPGLPATVRSVALAGGRRLLRPSGTWQEVLGIDGVHESYLDLTVHTAGPDPGLIDRAREEFDFVVRVKADYPRIEPDREERVNRSLPEMYDDYVRAADGIDPPEPLQSAFLEILEEVEHATS